MKLPALTPRRRSATDGSASPADWRRWVPAAVVRGVWEDLRANPGVFLISLLLAIVLWFTINVTERDAERVVDLPVTVRKLSPGLIVPDLPTKPVAFTLRGPRTILESVDEHKVRIALDLSAAAPGDQRIELGVQMVRPELPRRLKVVRIEPQRVRVQIDRLARRTLPVHPAFVGMPPLGYNIAESQVMPAEVEVSGPARKVDDLHEVTTDSIDLRTLVVAAGTTRIEQSVLLGWAGHFVSFNPDHVTVTIALEEVIIARDFRHVEVRVRNAGAVTPQLSPPAVDLAIRGPQRILHNFKLDPAAVSVDAAGLSAGPHKVTVQVDLPAALEVVRRAPETHTLTVQPTGGGRH